ncbi:hypothetical protein AU476_20100 [Cupriavidus sp. UYMSc13B]|nr:hypothetical protein AU476_20100 [Cupriavidus sp. UYMSc13B]
MEHGEGKLSSRVWSNVQYETDDGIGSRARIGMVVISNDQPLSYEARAMLTIPGVALYESRVLSARDRDQAVTVEILRRFADRIDGAIRQINTMRPSDVIALGCTSAAMVIGSQELKRRVREVHPRAHVTDPFTGILTAAASGRC